MQFKRGAVALVGLLCVGGCDTGSRDVAPTYSTPPGATAPGGGGGGGGGGSAPGGGTGGSTGPPGQFQLDPTVTAPQDIWHIDFDGLGDAFPRNAIGHGLGVGTQPLGAPINQSPRDAVIARVLSRISVAFLRNADGTGISGQSVHITFTAAPPDPVKFPGGPGTDYSRICLGSSDSLCSAGTLGVESLDLGNQKAEWACTLDKLGTFTGRICGLNSQLGQTNASGAPLTMADLKFVDGTYVLGSGTAAEDARFQEIDAVISDWATAIGNVVAHEVGHSVGLQHTTGGIMVGTVSSSNLSDSTLSFSQTSIQVLTTNIGIQP